MGKDLMRAGIGAAVAGFLGFWFVTGRMSPEFAAGYVGGTVSGMLTAEFFSEIRGRIEGHVQRVRTRRVGVESVDLQSEGLNAGQEVAAEYIRDSLARFNPRAKRRGDQ